MNQKKEAFAQRLEINSRNYSPRVLFDMKAAGEMLSGLYEVFGLHTLMTDRHGDILMSYGDFEGFVPDVVNKPGNKIRVKGRTVCHIYARYDAVATEQKNVVEKLLNAYIKTLEGYASKSYLSSEQAVYIDELEQELEKEAYRAKYDEQTDPLTGVLNKTYFIRRMKELASREVVPTGVICVNINDWMYAHVHYGEEESDRLITIVADILKRNADAQTIIGRVDGDIFHVLMPLSEEEEVQEYCRKIEEDCLQFQDDKLAPSVATGDVIKTNVEEDFDQLFSDAEYVMFEHKLQIKNAPGYRERLEKGSNLK